MKKMTLARYAALSNALDVRLATFNATLKTLNLISDPTPDVLDAMRAMETERKQLISATAALAAHFPQQHSQLVEQRTGHKEITT